MSIGNATQAVNFDRQDLTLVLGENLDLGSDGSRNGTGKTTLINALSYGLYGSALSDIKLNNLINKTNEKDMLVSIEFEVDSVEYRIERGRKPNLLKFYKDDTELNNDAQGENKETQKDIEKLLNLSHDMFKHSVALNTYTEPFLSMKANDQKNIIEQLLGITVLTEKAESLKELTKISKDSITEEEFRLVAVIKANEHIEEQIESLKVRHVEWQTKKDNTLSELSSAIESLLEVDIEAEIQKHKDNTAAKEAAKAEWYKLTDQSKNEHSLAMLNYFTVKESVATHNAAIDAEEATKDAKVSKYNTAVLDCNKWIKQLETDNKNCERRMQGLQKDIDLLVDHKCHSCGQDLHDAKQEENITAKQTELKEYSTQVADNKVKEDEYKLKLADLGSPPVVKGIADTKQAEPVLPIEVVVPVIIPMMTATFYSNVDDAHGHKSSLETLTAQLETAVDDADPYTDQIIEMETNGLQDVSYDEMNRLTELSEHQLFLLKLLTSKDSFIRKKIIEQNLAYLNNRLTHYLDEIGLPHVVRFQSDLSVEITEMGRDLDFDNLSRGERTRLILSLSWAFRDVWESLYSHINLLFVDELIDNGLDTSGVEAAIKIMKGMARERNKSVWLVSHREELISSVNNTMSVIKENGFTSYEGLIE